MSEQTTRTDVLRHRVGECPACRSYLWAEVLVEARMSAPTLAADGKAHVYASASPVGMTVSHECTPADDSDDEGSGA